VARILIVDDERANRLLVKTVLEHGGHSVIEASDGAQALEISGTEALDLLVADLSLPGMSGTELVRALRAREKTKSLAIALYTATAINDAMRDFMELYAIRHVVPKPCEPQDLLRAVEAALPR